MRAHRFRTAGDLVRSLALEPQSDEERSELRRSRFAAHYLVHDLAGLFTGEVVSVEQLDQGRLDHRPRKFLAISGPIGVSTDSGWNWTPSIGSSRCRTAMISRSAASAETSRVSGTEVAAREW